MFTRVFDSAREVRMVLAQLTSDLDSEETEAECIRSTGTLAEEPVQAY